MATERGAEPSVGDTPPRRPPASRRGLLYLAAAGALVVAVALAFAFVPRDGAPPSVSREAPAERSPQGEAILVGARPFGIAVGAGRVWVANLESDTLAVLDSRTGRRLGSPLPLAGGPWGVALGAGGVWVASFRTGRLTRLDPRTRRVEITVEVPRGSSWVAVAAGKIWITNAKSGGVSFLDPRSPETGAQTLLGGETTRGIAATETAVWVSHGARSVSEFDGASGALRRTITVGRTPTGVAVARGWLWVANTRDDNVSRIDLFSGEEVGRPTAVGARPNGLALGAGAMWVANGGDDSVTRLDPDTGRVVGDSIAVGRQPIAIRVEARTAWVTNNDANTVTRIEATPPAAGS